MQFIQAISGLLKTKPAAAALATPAAFADGLDITPWRNGATPRGYPLAAIALFADGACTVTNPALYGYGPYGNGGASIWSFISLLNNNGTTITLSPTLGFIQSIDLPSVFSALAVGGGVVGGANVGYTAMPISRLQ